MIRTLRLLSLGLLFCTAVTDVAPACGDKFLVSSRNANVRQANRSNHPGRVLLFSNPQSKLASSFLNKDLEALLARAGHDVQVVQDSRELEDALRQQSVDLILADFEDASNVEAAIAASKSNAHLLPVVDKDAKEAQKAAKNHFGSALKSGTKSNTLLLLVDDVMQRAKKASPES